MRPVKGADRMYRHRGHPHLFRLSQRIHRFIALLLAAIESIKTQCSGGAADRVSPGD